jgi:hypothetical protein
MEHCDRPVVAVAVVVVVGLVAIVAAAAAAETPLVLATVDDLVEGALMSVDCKPRMDCRMGDQGKSLVTRTKPALNSAPRFERSTWYRKCSSNDLRNAFVNPR